jgi:hypothetical protein
LIDLLALVQYLKLGGRWLESEPSRKYTLYVSKMSGVVMSGSVITRCPIPRSYSNKVCLVDQARQTGLPFFLWLGNILNERNEDMEKKNKYKDVPTSDTGAAKDS